MKIKIRKIMALICLIPMILGGLNIGEVSNANEEQKGIYNAENFDIFANKPLEVTNFSAKVQYPDGKDYVEATIDKFIVEFKLHINGGSEGDALNLDFTDLEKINISKDEFFLEGGVFKLEKTETGVRLVALKDFTSSDITLRIPTVFSKNQEGIHKLVYKLGNLNLSTEVEVNVKKIPIKFENGKLIKKSSFGAISKENLQWGIYYNYLESKISGNDINNYNFKEQVGSGIELIPSSIAAYNVSNHLLEGNVVNDNPTQVYNYDLSAFLQANATTQGWNITIDNEDTLKSLSLDKSIYIHYETKVIDGNFDKEYSNSVSLDAILAGDGTGEVTSLSDYEEVK